jgi:hypothetical protein
VTDFHRAGGQQESLHAIVSTVVRILVGKVMAEPKKFVLKHLMRVDPWPQFEDRGDVLGNLVG